MSVETFSPENIVQVSDSAAEHFRKRLDATHFQAIRLSLKESGCTGYKYVVDEVEMAEADDLKIELDNGVTLYVNQENLAELQGTQIDYVKEGLNSSLVLNNPNVKDACGCGESFSFN